MLIDSACASLPSLCPDRPDCSKNRTICTQPISAITTFGVLRCGLVARISRSQDLVPVDRGGRGSIPRNGIVSFLRC
ncbi:unnamed protein product [Zymoseptoria tritici ST99CH_3D7]|uniref:Uncharacterized protein n=1 Tax=Zymoseptoria tritici (strain ST99CH_3D7) TaxID=1276538 RepID=A0A1X7RE27_ZYMT9|nr:unnamed protein product [Zymoseptoria tritici ST99CH_3D7]